MNRPVWISHRGYHRKATENSAEAFSAAIACGFTHLETDLRVTADNHLVLCHDSDLERVSGKAIPIATSSRSFLEQQRLNGGERLLFFDSFLESFSGQHWIFDIKPEQGVAVIDALMQWAQQPGWRDFFAQRVRYLLWNPKQQVHLKRLHPQALCMARDSECRRAGMACLLGLPSIAGIQPGISYALPPRLAGINLMRHRILRHYQKRGAKVLAYLPEHDTDSRRVLAAGVDEVLTNDKPLSCSDAEEAAD